MGFLKKLKETAEKGIEKSVELGTKGYDSAKDAAKKGYDKARDEGSSNETSVSTEATKDSPSKDFVKVHNEKKEPIKETKSQTSDPEELRILKLRFAKGEITKEDFEEMRKMLE